MRGRSYSRREFVATSAGALAAGVVFAPNFSRAAESAQASAGAGRATSAGAGGLRAEFAADAQGLRLLRLTAPGQQTIQGPIEVCQLTIGGTVIAASALRVTAPLKVEKLTANPGAANLAERVGGRQITATLADPQGRFQLQWRAIQRDGSAYLRQEITLVAGASDVPVTQVTFWDLDASGAEVRGTVTGSPITLGGATDGGGWFAGFEHPLSHSTIADGRVRSTLTRQLPLPAGQSVTYSSVIGPAAAGQLRRTFLNYVERERAHPYRTFLHYNSWYDLGYFTPYDAQGCLGVIQAFGEELVRRRRVQMDSFLFDDGWDNHQMWGFNAGFPDGLTPLTQAATAIGAAPGIWLSPWGGYGKPRQERLAWGKDHGYEINREGFALSGPKYYERFHQACLEMVQRYKVNQFKLDGTGSTAEVVPGSHFGSDFEAAISLIGDLRAAEPGLFINLTTGTYPSPFWLRYADSTWRGGEDHSFAGVGTDRQQWITYRDGDTFRHVVGRGPLYPLNALMLHGIIYAQYADRLKTDPADDFDAEVRAYFGTGTQLQEMYISHQLLSSNNWDTLAEAARWARRNAATLVDTHWIGGDPAQLAAYGHAAWNGGRAVVTLRNPSDKPQEFALDVAEAFELPPGARTRFQMRTPWKLDQWRKPLDPAPVALEAGTSHTFSLQPFEVLTLEGAAV